jgi:hypothetical protein
LDFSNKRAKPADEILDAGNGVASDFSGEVIPLDKDEKSVGPKDGDEEGEG